MNDDGSVDPVRSAKRIIRTNYYDDLFYRSPMISSSEYHRLGGPNKVTATR